ncbi:dihydrolipoyl dehydrogenase [Candidatus Desantisbacteria bacterium CG1_02_49_89]|nr:MAG: dihydrolipoyl dehydrogenase [Candidatus Desantisbacteria bacterium CG1_02_49_89]
MAEYDAIVIGGGLGGYICAIRTAQLGGKACVIEEDKIGGTCLNRGCIPTKALLTTAGLFSRIKKAKDFGIKAEGCSVDFTAMMDRKEKIVARLRAGVEFLLKNNGIDIVKGKGKVTGKGTVEVTGGTEPQKTLSGRNIVVATGSVVARVPGIECNGTNIITSNEMLSLASVPSSLLIIGGGVIGCEFASLFSEIGTKITIVEMLPQILPLEDEEISKTFRRMLEKQGIKIYTDTKVNAVVSPPSAEAGRGLAPISIGADGQSSVVSELSNGEKIETEKVLVCTGRAPNGSGLGLEELGVKMDRARVIADEKMHTNIEGIYAVGDVNGGIMLAHVATAEGVVAAENIMGKDSRMDYTAVPGCIFTFPEIGSVGLTEKKARETGAEVTVGRFPFSACGKAIAMGEPDGFVKVIADKSGKVLGVHIIGPEATNLIAEAAVCIRNNIGIEGIAKTIHAHPTLPEAVVEAALDTRSEALQILRKKIG